MMQDLETEQKKKSRGFNALTQHISSKFKKHWKVIIAFVLFEAIFSVLTAPFLIYFGPFENLKTTLVGSVYTTFSHRYLVDTFMSQQAIERIIGKEGYYSGDSNQVDISEQTEVVNIKPVHSDKYKLVKVDGSGLKGYMVSIEDPTKVKVGYSAKLPQAGEFTSTIAKANKALVAVNAGGFSYDTTNSNWSSTGGGFEGYIIHEGKVIGNAHNDNDAKDDAIGLTAKGELIFGKYSVNELLKNDVKEAITFFGPQLIVKGKKMFAPGENGGLGIAPRTAIAQKSNGEIILLVIDGRDVFGSLGASMFDLQEILYANGAVNAIALDGGSSTAMYYNGKIINTPSNPMGERAIPSVFMMIPENGGTEK